VKETVVAGICAAQNAPSDQNGGRPTVRSELRWQVTSWCLSSWDEEMEGL
jgi:hypothetical protein